MPFVRAKWFSACPITTDCGLPSMTPAKQSSPSDVLVKCINSASVDEPRAIFAYQRSSHQRLSNVLGFPPIAHRSPDVGVHFQMYAYASIGRVLENRVVLWLDGHVGRIDVIAFWCRDMQMESEDFGRLHP